MLVPAQLGHSAVSLGQPGMLPPQPGLSRWLFQLNLVTQQLALVSQECFPLNQVSADGCSSSTWSLSSWPWSARAFTSTRSHTCSPGQTGSLLSSPDQASVMQSVMLQLLQQQFMQADVQVPGTMVVQGHHGFHHTVSIGLCSNPITRGCFFSASVRAETPN